MLDYYFILQVSSMLKQNIRYAIGLTIICFIVLILLWLPDFLKKEE